MRLQLVNQKIRSILIFTSFFFVSMHSSADTSLIEVPYCPKYVTIKNEVVIDANGWSYQVNSELSDQVDKSKVSATLTTEGKAPQITIINPKTNSIDGFMSPDKEDYTDDSEIFYWNRKYIFEENKPVFLCWALGSQDEHPVKNVYLYKNVPAKAQNCKITYYLKNDERSWENQKLECWSNH